LEVFLSDLVNKIAPINKKGFALGVYNIYKSFDIFIGGVLADFN